VVLERIAREQEGGAWWQTAVLTGLAQGLARHKGALGKTSLAKLLAEPPAALAAHAQRASALLAQTAALATNAKRPAADRVAAARLLAWLPAAEAEPALDGLLAASVPPAVQLAAIDALRTGHYDRSPPILLKHWNTLSPATRSAAVDLLLGKPATTLPFLQAMAEGKIPSSVVGLERRDGLLRHGQADIKKLAQDLFGGQVSPNRKAVAEQYAAALTATADATRGQAVFKRICAACHKVRGEGHDIGPDITDVRNKTRETLLYDILDPNRAVEPRWVSYVATTADGRAVTGLLASETANTVVLRRAEGKEDVLVRSEIEELQASGKSLMPEGVEKDITVAQMADLLEFLKARAAPGK
jgi:putative heme-binding domain-containing protein